MVDVSEMVLILTLSRVMFYEYRVYLRVEIRYELLTRCYVMCSGEDVGPLKWKETPPAPVTERAEPSNGAADQHLSDHGAFFWNTIDEEVQNITYNDLSRLENFPVTSIS